MFFQFFITRRERERARERGRGEERAKEIEGRKRG